MSYADVNGLSLYYEEHGSGDPLVLLHGGMGALRTAIQHPDRVRRVVLVSIPFRRDGSYPEVLAAMDAMGPELAEMIKQAPVYEHYARVAPRPEDWTAHIAKTSELVKADFDWS